MFAVAGGFLLALRAAGRGMRSRGDSLEGALPRASTFPPTRELVPALLADEAAGVVRDRGLLFLHGGRVLAFDRGAAVRCRTFSKPGPGRAAAGARCPSRRGRPSGSPRSCSNVPDPDPEEIYREIRKEMNRPDRDRGRRKPRRATEPRAGDVEASEKTATWKEAGEAGEPRRPRPKSIRELLRPCELGSRVRQAKAKRDGGPPSRKMPVERIK